MSKLNKETIMQVVIAESMNSKYYNVKDAVLYSKLNVSLKERITAADCASILNELYFAECIKVVKHISGTKVITTIAPTSKGMRAYYNRPVSKEVCFKVFTTICSLENDNAAKRGYVNVSHITLANTISSRVGVVSFDTALDKLLKAGYVKAETVNNKLTLYSTTKVGRERLAQVK